MLRIPRDKSAESSLALLREGYTFISSRCDRYQSDIFQARLLLQNTLCMRGEAAARLFEEHGAQLRIVEPLMDRSLLDGLNDFWRARLWSELLLLDETRRARVLPYVHAWAEGGARVSGVDAVRGFNQTFEMRRRAARLFGEIDLLLTPTNQVEAFPADWASPLNDPQRPFEHIVFTVPWNMGEQPALSINCGFTAAGMPIGLQLVAPRFADTWLLRIGKTYEGWRGPIHGWPRPPAD